MDIISLLMNQYDQTKNKLLLEAVTEINSLRKDVESLLNLLEKYSAPHGEVMNAIVDTPKISKVKTNKK